MENIKFVLEKSARIEKLVNALYEKMPEIESARGLLVTESYQQTEHLPIILRRSAAFAHILRNIPIVIRDNELVVGSATVAPRGCQVFPEYSYEWLEAEFDTVATRAADPFYISEQTKADLRKASGVSPNTMTKLRRDEPVMLNVLDKICVTLNCNYGDIMDYVPEEGVKE